MPCSMCRAGAADVAIRHARKPPLDFVTHEVFRDAYVPVCSPRLLEHHGPIERAADLLRLPLIHYDWINGDPDAPTWRQWLDVARSIDPDFNAIEKVRDLSFREELHAIDAVIGGQGVAICSDVIVSNELRSGLLVKAHPLSLPGYGFYLVSMAHSPRAAAIEAFSTWMRGSELKAATAVSTREAMGEQDLIPSGRCYSDARFDHMFVGSSRPDRATNAALELPIGLESLRVGKGQYLHHDHAGDPRRRIDPVIGVEQARPCQAARLAAVRHRDRH